MLVKANTGVVEKLIPDLDTSATALPPSATAGLMRALMRHRSTNRLPRLSFREQLRSGRITPAPMTAVLLDLISFDSTRPELARIVADDITPLITFGPDIARIVLDIAAMRRKSVPVKVFEDTCGLFHPSTAERIGIKTSTPRLPLARRILNSPERWPGDIVRLAADIAAEALSGQQPLAEVAAANRWFAE